MPHQVNQTLHEKSLPTVFQLGPNLFVACFWLMKLGVARQMIEEAILRGQVSDDGLIVESTSGTMGYGLCLAGRAMGLRVQLVGDPVIDSTFKELLELFGVEVHIVTEHLDNGGYQVPRLRKVSELLDLNRDAHWVQQYDNGANPRSYSEAADWIAHEVGQVDHLVAAVGSGGSISGTVSRLRHLGHPAHATAVDTHGSVLFGQHDGHRTLRGLGNSITPQNLNYSLIDSVHWVEACDAFCATRLLLTDHGIDMGPTTGAAFMAAAEIARRNPDESVVFLGPDRAERYLTTVYSPSWCEENGVLVDELPDGPYSVEHPEEADGGWASMEWNRRPITEFHAAIPAGVAS